MNDEKDNRSHARERDNQAPSAHAILLFFVVFAIAMAGGYFLLMRPIDISRQEDCMLAGGRNCATPIEVPVR